MTAGGDGGGDWQPVVAESGGNHHKQHQPWPENRLASHGVEDKKKKESLACVEEKCVVDTCLTYILG